MAEDFEAACKAASRDLRRVPAELRKRLGREVLADVTEPLANDIRASFDGPYRRVLVGGTKARIQSDPMIVVGGARKVLSGGASVRDVAFGDEFGGGSRVSVVPTTGKRRGHQRHTTRQFRSPRGNIFHTISTQLDTTFTRWADVVGRLIDEVVK